MLWMGQDRSNAAEHIAGVLPDPDGPGSDHMIAGLLNLSMLLGFELAKPNGATDGPAWLREHLSHRSLDLPELSLAGCPPPPDRFCQEST